MISMLRPTFCRFAYCLALALLFTAGSVMAQEQFAQSFDSLDGIGSWKNSSSEPGYVLSLSEDAAEGDSSLHLSYDFVADESWGGSVDFNYAADGGFEDLASYDGISFMYRTVDPVDPTDAVSFVVKLVDMSTGVTENWETSVTEVITDDSGVWQEVTIPFDAFSIPSWAEQGDGELNLDAIAEWQMQVIAGGGGVGNTYQGEILIDDLNVYADPVELATSFESMANIGSWKNSSSDPGYTIGLTDDAAEGDSALQFSYNFIADESWGGSVDFAHQPPGGYVDLAAYDGISFMYKTVDPVEPTDAVNFVVKIVDVSAGVQEFWEVSATDVITDGSGEWQEVMLPFESFSVPSWAEQGDSELNLDAIAEWQMQVIAGGGGVGNTYQGEIRIDAVDGYTEDGEPLPAADVVWSFEDENLGNWYLLDDDSYTTTGGLTDAMAVEGTYSVEVTAGSDAANAALVNDASEVAAGDTIQYRVWVGADQLAGINGLQPFVQYNEWAGWVDTWNGADGLMADAWNTLQVVVPDTAESVQRIGVQVTGTDAASTSTIYVDYITVDEFDDTQPPPPPPTGNLVTNGSFEKTAPGVVDDLSGGIEGWVLETTVDPAPVFEIVDDVAQEGDRALKVVVDEVGSNSWDIQAVGDSIPVTPGGTYEYSVWARTDSGSALAHFTVGNYSFGEYGREGGVVLSEEWQEITLSFTINDDSTWARAPIHFSLSGNQGQTIYIDNLEIAVPPPPPPAIGETINPNGSFAETELGANEAEGWSFLTASGGEAEFAIVDDAQDADERALRVNILNTGTNADDWNIEAINEPFDVEEGATYQYTVWMKADSSIRDARVILGQPESGNWARPIESDEELTTEWQRFSYLHVASASEEETGMRAPVSLNVGGNADPTADDTTQIYIDNLQIIKLSEQEVDVDPAVFASWTFEDVAPADTNDNGHIVHDGWANGSQPTAGSAVLTDERAYLGTQSVRLTSTATSADVRFRRHGPYPELTPDWVFSFMIWISADDLENVDHVRGYFQDESFQGGEIIPEMLEAENIVPNTWNEFQFAIPDGYGTPMNRVGLILEATSADATPSMYVDFVTIREDPTFVSADSPEKPLQFALEQNYPNPFNPSTTIEYGLDASSKVTLAVYNVLGQRVATLVDEPKAAGRHTVQFDAQDLASGVYFYRITAGDNVKTRQMVLVK